MSFLFPAGLSIVKESEAIRPHFEHAPDRLPTTHHLSLLLSRLRSPESAPLSLSTSRLHRPYRTCTPTASALPPSLPYRSHIVSASRPCPALTRSSPRRVSGRPQNLRP